MATSPVAIGGPPLQVSPQPPRSDLYPRGSCGRANVRLKRDWLTGGFVPSHGGIGSFLPVVKPGTPRARQQPTSGTGKRTGVGERTSDSCRSDLSSLSRSGTSSRGSDRHRLSRSSISSRGSNSSRLSGQGRSWPEPSSRFSDVDGSSLLVRADDGSGSTQLVDATKPVHLRYNLTLNSDTQAKEDLEAAAPEFLRRSLRNFHVSKQRPRLQSPRRVRMHDSDTARELLSSLDLDNQANSARHAQEEEEAAAKHPRVAPRTRCGLVPTMRTAKRIGLRAEVETCAGILLQACVRSHIARKDLRLKRQVALWGQACYCRVKRRKEMLQYGRRIAQARSTTLAGGNASFAQAEAALKQKQWQYCMVNDRFLKFKREQGRDRSLAGNEQQTRDLERKWAEIKAVELRVAEEKSRFLTDAKRTVWVGRVPMIYATERVMMPLMECIGKVTSIHIRVKMDTGDVGASWALVMFEDKHTAERSLDARVRADCGLDVTRSWNFCEIKPEKIESLKAKIALAKAQMDGLALDLETRRQQREAIALGQAETRERERLERERRTVEISATWEKIDREQRAIEATNQRHRIMKQKTEERKIYVKLLSIVLNAWSAYATVRTRLNALDKRPDIRQRTVEIVKLMKTGDIPLGRRTNVGGNLNVGTASAGGMDLSKWNPTVHVLMMNAFYREQVTLIRAFVSWRIYIQTLLKDAKLREQTSKALRSFSFYKLSVRDFGVQMKLDKIDGLREDAPSIHKWLSPRERHERNLADKSDADGSTRLSSATPTPTTDCKPPRFGHGDEIDEGEHAGDKRDVDEPPCRWTPAEEDLLDSLFPGTFSTA